MDDWQGLADAMLRNLSEKAISDLVRAGFVRGEFVPFEGWVYKWTD